eukprot:gene16864-28411_t
MFVLLSGSVEIRVVGRASAASPRRAGRDRAGRCVGRIDWHLGQRRRYLARACERG